MKIEHLRIQGYRSLADVELTPNPLTVVVGANNAGKSNLVDAIWFLANVYERDFEPALNNRGGFPHVAFRQDDDPPDSICFELQASLSFAEVKPLFGEEDIQTLSPGTETVAPGRFSLQHCFELEQSGEHLMTGFSIVKEEIELVILAPERQILLIRFSHDKSGLMIELPGSDMFPPAFLPEAFRNENALRSVLEDPASPPSSLLPRLRLLSPLVNLFVSNLAKMRPYRLLPPLGRHPGIPSANGDMSFEGQNLPALIAYLQEWQETAWEATNQALAALDPRLEEVRVVHDYDRRLRLEFIEADTERTWTANEVSDGTIRALAMFAAVNDPRWNVQLIEEPENSLHPWALREFVDACRAVTTREQDPAKQKQIVLTTHSPVLLDYVRPEDVLVAWREQGKTLLRPLTELDPDAAKLWANGDIATSELIDSGWVREVVPGGVG